MLFAKNINNIAILFINKSSIKLKRVVYTPDYDTNLIFWAIIK